FHNNGDGTFTDVSAKAGVADPRAYYGLASVFVDVDDDGWLDLLVANDSVPKYFYRNKRDGTFEDASYLSGFALNDEGREQAAMGIAVSEYNDDGKMDICITNFSDDYDTLYRNDGDASFTDVSFAAGIANVTIPFLGWGTGFLDYDNDGWLDLFVANGHVYPGVDKQDWGTTWAQRPLKLLGGPKCPRDAVGAKVFVTAGGMRQRADVFSGASYASSSDQHLHFGLGSATKVDKIEIVWPDGFKEDVKVPTVDEIVTIVE